METGSLLTRTEKGEELKEIQESYDYHCLGVKSLPKKQGKAFPLGALAVAGKEGERWRCSQKR